MKKSIILISLILSFAIGVIAQDDYHKFEVSGGYSFQRTNGYPGDQKVTIYNYDALSYDSFSTFRPTNRTVTAGSQKTHKLNGFKASAVYNFSRYFGAKFEFSEHLGSDSTVIVGINDFAQKRDDGRLYQSITFSTGGLLLKRKQRDYRYLSGIQFKDNSKTKRLKPFAHALFGIAQQANISGVKSTSNGVRLSIPDVVNINAKSFSMAFGGGLDIRISKRFDIRVIDLDYNPVYGKEKKLIALGEVIDSMQTHTFGPLFTSLQDVIFPKHRQNNFRIGFGIVFH